LLAWVGLVVAGAALVASPQAASAFCGTYVSGGDADLFNNATQVVMMRDGQQTVLSMRNDYQGPPDDFAIVIPTPQVLQKDDVKTIEDDVFDRIDRLTAPRLVEYWEKDPCSRRRGIDVGAFGDAAAAAPTGGGGGRVDVEAQFDVGEYEVVVLSSSESSALETWLQDNDYNVPQGAGSYLRPYVQQGQYFFVARVDTDKVNFKNGRAVLSPLRFHYQSDEFKLPVRLGLINSQGKQDLIVNILAPDGQRYRAANYPNATIPTNLRVKESVKNYFPSFYRALFKRTLKQNRKNGQNPVVTEYVWGASKCDPCPEPPLDRSYLLTLGADVISEDSSNSGGGPDAGMGTSADAGPDAGSNSGRRSRRPPRRRPTGWTITRLHARYDADTLGEDLVFEPAPAIRGGQGLPGNLKQGAQTGARANSFQGRYIITHPWNKAITCDNPRRGRWGGKPGSDGPSTSVAPSQTNKSALSNGSGGGASSKSSDEVDLDEAMAEGDLTPPVENAQSTDSSGAQKGCGCSTGDERAPFPFGAAAAVLLAATAAVRRRWRS
jgi:MYXO-CTERM domain-containing protein